MLISLGAILAVVCVPAETFYNNCTVYKDDEMSKVPEATHLWSIPVHLREFLSKGRQPHLLLQVPQCRTVDLQTFQSMWLQLVGFTENTLRLHGETNLKHY